MVALQTNVNIPDSSPRSTLPLRFVSLRAVIDRKPPDRLPIVPQFLLSQENRLRARVLLSNFLDLGPWAANVASSIDIFPYVRG